ncbi:hypothetical protein L9G15_23825, partial [Shewanella sp. A3A]|nr:hypothetical protein [Shewanella ferrihydritica]
MAIVPCLAAIAVPRVIVIRTERVLPNSMPPDFMYPTKSRSSIFGGSRTALLLKDQRSRNIPRYCEAIVARAA